MSQKSKSSFLPIAALGQDERSDSPRYKDEHQRNLHKKVDAYGSVNCLLPAEHPKLVHSEKAKEDCRDGQAQTLFGQSRRDKSKRACTNERERYNTLFPIHVVILNSQGWQFRPPSRTISDLF